MTYHIDSDALLKLTMAFSKKAAPIGEASNLSPREIQVLRQIADGKTSKEIALALDLSLGTVRGYRKTASAKIGVRSVAGVCHYMAQHDVAAKIPISIAQPEKYAKIFDGLEDTLKNIALRRAQRQTPEEIIAPVGAGGLDITMAYYIGALSQLEYKLGSSSDIHLAAVVSTHYKEYVAKTAKPPVHTNG